MTASQAHSLACFIRSIAWIHLPTSISNLEFVDKLSNLRAASKKISLISEMALFWSSEVELSFYQIDTRVYGLSTSLVDVRHGEFFFNWVNYFACRSKKLKNFSKKFIVGKNARERQITEFIRERVNRPPPSRVPSRRHVWTRDWFDVRSCPKTL